MSYETILYKAEGAIATITLNRPERLNTIVPPMPEELEAAVHAAVADPEVKVIVLRGAGRSFCAGFDFGGGFHHWDEGMTTDGRWDPGKDFAMATADQGPIPRFMSIWRSPKPVICQVHGWLTGMWLYRLGLTKAKEHALTGKSLSGRDAAEIELINASVPFAELETTVHAQAEQLAEIPSSQLAAMKLVVNQAYENMGLASTQTLGPILDGLMRNTPDAERFIEVAEQDGVGAAVAERDGPFGDYSQAAAADRPDPDNVIVP